MAAADVAVIPEICEAFVAAFDAFVAANAADDAALAVLLEANSALASSEALSAEAVAVADAGIEADLPISVLNVERDVARASSRGAQRVTDSRHAALVEKFNADGNRDCGNVKCVAALRKAFGADPPVV